MDGVQNVEKDFWSAGPSMLSSTGCIKRPRILFKGGHLSQRSWFDFPVFGRHRHHVFRDDFTNRHREELESSARRRGEEGSTPFAKRAAPSLQTAEDELERLFREIPACASVRVEPDPEDPKRQTCCCVSTFDEVGADMWTCGQNRSGAKSALDPHIPHRTPYIAEDLTAFNFAVPQVTRSRRSGLLG